MPSKGFIMDRYKLLFSKLCPGLNIELNIFLGHFFEEGLIHSICYLRVHKVFEAPAPNSRFQFSFFIFLFSFLSLLTPNSFIHFPIFLVIIMSINFFNFFLVIYIFNHCSFQHIFYFVPLSLLRMFVSGFQLKMRLREWTFDQLFPSLLLSHVLSFGFFLLSVTTKSDSRLSLLNLRSCLSPSASAPQHPTEKWICWTQNGHRLIVLIFFIVRNGFK